jgi:hypothetical protein
MGTALRGNFGRYARFIFFNKVFQEIFKILLTNGAKPVIMPTTNNGVRRMNHTHPAAPIFFCPPRRTRKYPRAAQTQDPRSPIFHSSLLLHN